MPRTTKHLFLTTLAGVALTVTATVVLFSESDASKGRDRSTTRVEGVCRDDHEDDRDDDDRDDDRPTSSSTTTTTTAAAPKGQILPDFTVGLPRATFVKVDRRGRIVQAATNSSCPPTPGDVVYVVLGDGSIINAPHLDLDSIRWRGSFGSPGVYYRQDPQRGCLLPTPCRTDRR